MSESGSLTETNLPLQNSKISVLKLASCQALAMTGNSVLFTVAALIGANLLTDKSWATLPLALLHLATLFTTIPASLWMARMGRKVGFATGIGMGMLGAGLGAYAIFAGSFVGFCLAMVLLGCFNGFVGYYRFAAAELASESFRSMAISLVVAGGVVAAVLGPQLATWTKDWFAEAPFAGCLLTIILLQAISLPLLASVPLPPWQKTEQVEQGRPLLTIIRQPVFVVAMLGSMLGYGVMVLIMTSTPLAMVEHAFPFHQAAFVIQWHVLGMFAPSFITGALIVRFGLLNIILTGGILNLICIAINLSGISLMHYWTALLLLGIGWNFLFVGSTTLLTEAYTPAERAKTQAAHDFLMFSGVAASTILSGDLLNRWGWQAVNWAGLPMVLLAFGAVFWLQKQRGRAPWAKSL